MSEKWSKVLQAFESGVVIVAGVAALFPIWQFVNERDDRALDRHANFISAHAICQELESKHSERGTSLSDDELQDIIDRARDGANLTGANASIAGDPEGWQQYLYLRNSRIYTSCVAIGVLNSNKGAAE